MKTMLLNEFNNNELIALRNKIETELLKRDETTTCMNKYLLIEMIANLVDGVGDGYIESDYYAPTRYYCTPELNIDGVKNIRLERRETATNVKYTAVVVKLLDPRGFMLPKSVKVRGKGYIVEYSESARFTNKVQD